MIELLSGALVLAYLLAALHFLRFWRRTHDPLFRTFSVAFLLFALNTLAVSVPGISAQTDGYEYVLRVLGFVLILLAIVKKNFPKVPRA